VEGANKELSVMGKRESSRAYKGGKRRDEKGEKKKSQNPEGGTNWGAGRKNQLRNLGNRSLQEKRRGLSEKNSGKGSGKKHRKKEGPVIVERRKK